MKVQEDLMLSGASRADIAYREISASIQAGRSFDAVVTMDDWSALAAVQALSAHGLRVPEDVRVTGFDDYPIATASWPRLTTVDQSLDIQGRLAASRLLQQWATGTDSGTSLVDCRLEVRGSTVTFQGRSERDSALATVAAAQSRLAAQNALLRLNRALIQSTRLNDVASVLAEQAPSLGIARCFLVIHDEDRYDGADPQHRLVLDYRDGAVHSAHLLNCPEGELLPPGLGEELHAGALVLQPLSVPGRRLGYMLFEQHSDSIPVAEAFRLDLSRTIASLVTVAEMEQLVANRTTELRLEVATRRRAEQALQRAVGKLSESLLLDGLTGIANRVAFQQKLDSLHRAPLDAADDLSLLMIDVDDFKAYNDALGHLMGDEALRAVADCLSRSAGHPTDLACRYGGEEFGIILPHSDLKAAVVVAERVQQLLATAAVRHPGSAVSSMLTASIGVVCAPAGARWSPEALVQAADDALYRAKALGRNTYAVAEALA
jgi:diguanylate cyclase (GGDEF)-like protein